MSGAETARRRVVQRRIGGAESAAPKWPSPECEGSHVREVMGDLWMSVCPVLYQFFCLSVIMYRKICVCLFVLSVSSEWLSVIFYIYYSVCLFVCISNLCLFFRTIFVFWMSVCHFLYIFFCLSACLHIKSVSVSLYCLCLLNVCLSFVISILLSVCLYVHIYLSDIFFVYMSVSLLFWYVRYIHSIKCRKFQPFLLVKNLKQQ